MPYPWKHNRETGSGRPMLTVTPKQLNELFDKADIGIEGVSCYQRWLQDKVSDVCSEASDRLSSAINDAAYAGFEIAELNEISKQLESVCERYFSDSRFAYDDDIIT